MTTFLVCVFIWRVEPQSAVVTAIIAGGWWVSLGPFVCTAVRFVTSQGVRFLIVRRTSVAPFLIHLLVLKDVPIGLWLMVNPVPPVPVIIMQSFPSFSSCLLWVVRTLLAG